MSEATMIQSAFLASVQKLDQAAADISLYTSAQQREIPTNIPFYVTVAALELEPAMIAQLHQLGAVLSRYFALVARLRGDDPRFAFFRPDIMITEQGLKVCEVETSPFGMALTLFLQRNIVVPGVIGDVDRTIDCFLHHWEAWHGTRNGRFVYSDHSSNFVGQLRYLANVLRERGHEWRVEHVASIVHQRRKMPSYRCFYSFERASDLYVARFCEFQPDIIPTDVSLFEGKKMLALWRTPLIQNLLSPEDNALLEAVLMPTWIVTPDVPQSFPSNIRSWMDLAELPKSQRRYVLKRAGGHPDASWARSVLFLHKRSTKEVEHALRMALLSPGDWVIQDFYGNIKYTLPYAEYDLQTVRTMKGRVRLTPYYDFLTGKLLVAKATLRRDTLFIHGATDSINTVIAESS